MFLQHLIIAHMKRLKAIIARLFVKRKTVSSLFTEAIAEGIRETFKEVRYKAENEMRNGREL